ncbi:MAG: amino acid adenylation domain-containing protein, partial [Tumebacillaceae bacterium]
LPDYMVPAQYMLLEELPLTPSGKVDRKALPIPDGAIMATSREYVAPTTPTEQLLAGLWEELLSVEQISVHDSFFELGGHSLLGTRFISQIRKNLGVELPVRALFEHATISELAVLLERELHAAKETQAPSFLSVDRERDMPLSFAQERLFVLDQIVTDKTVYNMPFAVRLRGTLEVGALEVALSEIIKRHESLRTTFVLQDGIPTQRIATPQPVALPIVDLRELEATEREAQVLHLIQADVEQPFDLQTGPLVRFLLMRLDDVEHVLMANMHHIVSDGWSMGIFTEEIAKIYLATAHKMEPDLPAMSGQYADFAIWQRNWLQGEVLDAQMAFWKEQLGGELPVLEMPTDRPRPSVQTYRGADEEFTVPRHLTKALKALSLQQGATLFMTLLSAYQTLLHRYTGQTDIIVGTPIAGRNRKETERLIGFFVNTMVLRTSFEGNPTFTELLQQVRETSLEVFANQDVPFEKLVDELKLQRDPSRTPLFQTMFILQNAPFEEAKLPGLTLLPVEFDNPTAKFDLSIHLRERGEELVGALNYNTDLFDQATAERLVQHYLNLLQGISEDAKQVVSALPVLTEAERQQLIGEWQEGKVDVLQTPCIHKWFETQVEKTPNAVAVVYEQQSLTYRELNEKANQVAHTLQKRGICPDALVAICMERSLELIVGLLGILKAGGAYLPLDPTAPSDRISFILEDAGATVLITQEHLVEQLPAHQAQVICLDADREQIAMEPVTNPVSEVTPDHLAYVIYTSGSTGQPKGVLIPHRNVTRLFGATEEWYGFANTDVWTLFHSYAFDFSVWEIWGALLYGGKLVVVPYLTSRSPEAFYELLIEEQVTVLNQTPSAFQQLLQTDAANGSENELALRYVIFGGEALDLQMLRPWFERHGDDRTQLVNMYGITETTVHVTYRPITQKDLDNELGSMIGVPIPDLRLYVLDAHLQPLPFGVTGEMFVGGAGLAQGYLNRPELTAERFVETPYGRLYKTGDLARRFANGELEYQGRIDNQVKIRGFRIELGEISAVLTTHPQVSQAVVTVYTDANGHKNLVAYVLPIGEQEIPPAELRKYLQSKLLSHMIPAYYVVLREFPLTTNGKVDMKKLPAPDLDAVERVVYVAPRNRTEEVLA